MPVAKHGTDQRRGPRAGGSAANVKLRHFPHPLPEVFPDLDAQSAAQSKGLGAQAALDLDLRTHMRECFYDPDLARRYLANFKGLTISGPVNDAMSRAVEQVDLRPQLHRITAPTLILS